METLSNKPIQLESSFKRSLDALSLANSLDTPMMITATETWLRAIESKVEEKTAPDVIEHTVLQFIERKLTSDGSNSNHFLLRVRRSLVASRHLITGCVREAASLESRLPKRVLRNAPREERLFHQALFHQGTLGVRASVRTLIVDYVPRIQDLVILFAFIATVSFSAIGREIAVAFGLGYIFSSFMEHLVHLCIAHATPAIKARLEGFGGIGRDMLRFNTEHSIHHGIVSKNYVENFSTLGGEQSQKQKETQKKIDAFLLHRGGEKLLQLVKNSQYGLGSSNHLRTHLFFLPISLLLAFICGLGLSTLGVSVGPLFFMTFAFAGQMWITTSAIYHPCLHKTKSEIENGGRVLRFLLNTRLSRFIARSHKMHHAMGGRVNQNLNLGSDFFLGWAPIRLPELIELKNQDVLF